MMLVEKYRPRTLEDVIGGKELQKLQESLLKDPWSMPNLLLTTRSAGTGKTSIARAIINQLATDSVFLNASDDRGINVIRDKVKEFAMTQGFVKNAPKIVHFDEADGLTKEAQESLRSIMEQYSSNCRFIFTCNNESKIIEPIKSRCVQINLNNPPKDAIVKRLDFIAISEKIPIAFTDLQDICEFFYPDIRSMINELDSIKHFGTGQRRDVGSEIYGLLKQRKFTEARKLWIAEQVNPRTLVKAIYSLIMVDDDLTKEQIVTAVEYVAETDFRIAMGSDAEITLANLAFKLVGSVFK